MNFINRSVTVVAFMFLVGCAGMISHDYEWQEHPNKSR